MQDRGIDDVAGSIAQDESKDASIAREEVALFKPSALTAILLSDLRAHTDAPDVRSDDEANAEAAPPAGAAFDPSAPAVHVRIDKQLKVTLRDTCSALLVFYNDDVAESNEVVYILDLMANVRKRREEFSPNSKLCAVTYQYRRLKQEVEFEVFPSQDGNEGLQNVQALDFTLGQFTMMEDQSAGRRRSRVRSSRLDLTEEDPDQGLQVEYDSAPGTPRCDDDDDDALMRAQHRPNVVARGLEGSGSMIRTALRSGGRYTGEAIRFLGKQYTSLLAPAAEDGEDEERDGDDDEANAASTTTAAAGANIDASTTAASSVAEGSVQGLQEAVACEERDHAADKSSLEEDIAAALTAQRSGSARTHESAAVPSEARSAPAPAPAAEAQQQPHEQQQQLLPRTNSDLSDHSTGSSSRRGKAIDPQVLARAQSHKRWAEGVHSGARTVTGTALYPVRWTGKKAAEWGKGGSDAPVAAPEDQNVVIRALSDTLGGVGNGVMSICKGVTEALGEVGSAVGDCAMHHATVVHGEEYAQRVTKCYVDAASEIGLAGYRVANLVALGWQGIILEAVIEGTVLAVALYDYLVGPVLLMGYVEMIQLPQTELRRYFVVLRPWSLSFYRSSEDFTRKPYKIVPTSLLDTMPKLRIRSESLPAAGAVKSGSGEKSTQQQQQHMPGLVDPPDAEDASHRKMLSLGEPAQMKTAAAAVRRSETDPADEVAGEDEEQDDEYWYRSDYSNFDTSISPVVKKFEPHLDLNSKPALLLAKKSTTALDDYTAPGMQVLTRAEDGVAAASAASASASASAPTSEANAAAEEIDVFTAIHDEAGAASAAAAADQPSEGFQPAQNSKRWYSVLSKWYGGNTDHIELNTIDCSSYLLYPALPANVLADESQRQQYEKIEIHTRLWYQELKEATKRVETISKRKFGAEEIALYRRLSMFPKTRMLLITVKRFVHTTKPRSLFGGRGKDGSIDTSKGNAAVVASPSSSASASASNQQRSGAIGGWFSFFTGATNTSTATATAVAVEGEAESGAGGSRAVEETLSPAQVCLDRSYSDRVAEAVLSTERYGDDGGEIMEGDQEISAAMAASLLDEETYFDYEDFIFIDDDEYIEGSHADADNSHLNMYSIYSDSTYVNELQRYNKQFMEPHNPMLVEEEYEPQSMGSTPCTRTPASTAGKKHPAEAGFFSENDETATATLAARMDPASMTPPRASVAAANSAAVTPTSAAVVPPSPVANAADASFDAAAAAAEMSTPRGSAASAAFACFPRRTGSINSPGSDADSAAFHSGTKGRSIFTAKVTTTFVPITNTGVEVAPEQSTTDAVDLLRMPDYLCNISAQLNALIAQKRAADESDAAANHAAAAATAAASAVLPEAHAHVVAAVESSSGQQEQQRRLMACKTLEDNLRLYSQVSQKKLVADWESQRIFKALASDADPETAAAIQMSDTIEVKSLNRCNDLPMFNRCSTVGSHLTALI